MQHVGVVPAAGGVRLRVRIQVRRSGEVRRTWTDALVLGVHRPKTLVSPHGLCYSESDKDLGFVRIGMEAFAGLTGH